MVVIKLTIIFGTGHMILGLKLLNALSSLLIGLHLNFEEIKKFSQIYMFLFPFEDLFAEQ